MGACQPFDRPIPLEVLFQIFLGLGYSSDSGGSDRPEGGRKHAYEEAMQMIAHVLSRPLTETCLVNLRLYDGVSVGIYYAARDPEDSC